MSRRNLLLFFVCTVLYQSISLKVQFYSWYPLLYGKSNDGISAIDASEQPTYMISWQSNSTSKQSNLRFQTQDADEGTNPVPTLDDIHQLSFRFPSVEERIEYYMGSWYSGEATINATAMCQSIPWFPTSGNLPEGTPSSSPFLFDATSIGHFPILAYAKDSQKNLFDHATNASSLHAVMRFADLHDPAATWPQISKSRLIDSDNGRKDIVILLKENRHYSAIEKVQNIAQSAWEDKEDVLVWRGGTTGRPREPGSRWRVVSQYFNATGQGVDIAFNEVIEEKMATHYKGYNATAFVRENMALEELLQYKYLLSVQGNDVASGLKWMLYSNPVVFMVPPTIETFAMEGLLIPWYHYIPLREDFADVLEKLEWARKHDAICQQISRQATEFMEKLYVSDQARKDNDSIHKGIAVRYEAEYSVDIGTCKTLSSDSSVNIT